jgi:SAM-dependent methyltransferase
LNGNSLEALLEMTPWDDEFYDLTEKFYLTRNKKSDIHIDEPESLAKQVGWQSYQSQNQNFEIATDLEDISWGSVNSVLDVGCGCGELVRYLREVRGFTGTYTGIDILERFIHKATQRYGDDSRNTFICGNILSCNQLLSSYDIVISMGTLTVNYDYPSACGEKTAYFTKTLIELICSLAQAAVVLYFIDEEKTTFMERAIAENMALYHADRICDQLIQSSKSGYKQLTIASYPNPASSKTIAKIYYGA